MSDNIVELLPTLTEYYLSKQRPKVKYVKTFGPQKHVMTMDVFDFFYLGLAKLVPEAHEDQQAKHSVLEMVNHDDRVNVAGLRRGVRFKAVHKDVQDPLARSSVGLESRRVEDLGGEVAAEDAPRGAVESGADVVLVAVKDLGGEEGGGAVGKYGAVLDEGFVG